MNKTERFELRLTEKQMSVVRTKSNDLKMSLTEYALYCMLNAEVKIGKINYVRLEDRNVN